MEIIKAQIKNINDVINISMLMWSNHSREELKKEYLELINLESAEIFLLFVKNELIGFAQCQLRYDYVEGTRTSPVGYLEGIFIKKEYRRKGYAKKMLLECENWAKEKDCLEFASDSNLDNYESFNFHVSNGFKEANRIICYTKNI